MATHWQDGTPIMRGPGDPWRDDPPIKWVRVSFENNASGVWDVSGCGRVPEELPISEALQARILALADWYDAEDRRRPFEPPPFYWEQFPDAPVAAFNAKAREVARDLFAELKDWTVVYCDIDDWCRPDDAPNADDRGMILRPGDPHQSGDTPCPSPAPPA